MDLTEYQAEVILVLARCDMNVAKTSKMLYLHRNTVRYQLDGIEKKTGIDPRSFYGLIQLVQEAEKTKAENEKGTFEHDK